MARTNHDTGASRPTAFDGELVGRSSTLRRRAESLRRQASELDDLLAPSYRRRASELELAAWVAELRSGIPLDEIHAIAA